MVSVRVDAGVPGMLKAAVENEDVFIIHPK